MDTIIQVTEDFVQLRAQRGLCWEQRRGELSFSPNLSPNFLYFHWTARVCISQRETTQNKSCNGIKRKRVRFSYGGDRSGSPLARRVSRGREIKQTPIGNGDTNRPRGEISAAYHRPIAFDLMVRVRNRVRERERESTERASRRSSKKRRMPSGRKVKERSDVSLLPRQKANGRENGEESRGKEGAIQSEKRYRSRGEKCASIIGREQTAPNKWAIPMTRMLSWQSVKHGDKHVQLERERLWQKFGEWKSRIWLSPSRRDGSSWPTVSHVLWLYIYCEKNNETVWKTVCRPGLCIGA